MNRLPQKGSLFCFGIFIKMTGVVVIVHQLTNRIFLLTFLCH